MPLLSNARVLIALSLTYLSTISRAQTPYDPVCGLIANAVSPASSVAYPGQPPPSHKLKNWHILNGCRTGGIQFNTDISHFTSSSSQPAACTVEPGTVADVGIVVGRLLISSLQTPCLTASASVDDTRKSTHPIRGTHPRSSISMQNLLFNPISPHFLNAG